MDRMKSPTVRLSAFWAVRRTEAGSVAAAIIQRMLIQERYS
jgi:hypothetical protein